MFFTPPVKSFKLNKTTGVIICFTIGLALFIYSNSLSSDNDIFSEAEKANSPSKIKKLYYKASSLASNGDANAQYLLYALFLFGEGTPKDDVFALHWLTMAAKNEHAKAQYELAQIYYQGRHGLKKDTLKGDYWLNKSTRNGYILQ